MHGRRRKMRGSLFLCFALLTSLRKPHIAGWYGSHALPPCPLLHFYFSWILPISFLRDIHFISRSNLLLQTANINNQLRATCNLYNYFSFLLPTALLYLFVRGFFFKRDILYMYTRWTFSPFFTKKKISYS